MFEKYTLYIIQIPSLYVSSYVIPKCAPPPLQISSQNVVPDKYLLIYDPSISVASRFIPNYLTAYLIENVVVTVNCALFHPNSQHFLVPILKPLLGWYFLLWRMAVENIVNAFVWRICPNMGMGIAKLFGILKREE
jgi:hypothetical protein